MMKKGYFLIEALLAIVMFSMIVMTLFSMISFLQRRTVRSSFEAEAGALMQEGMELSHSSVLASWNSYPDGVYSPVFDANRGVWVLFPGSEDGLQARYGRSITLSKVCRNANDGEQIPCTTLTPADPNSRLVETEISWTENDEEKSIRASLLLFKLPE